MSRVREAVEVLRRAISRAGACDQVRKSARHHRMSFLDRLLGRRPDPTLTWRAETPPLPDFDLAQMSFGALRFGDPIEAASFLGRADHFEWIQPKYCTLLYASRGFQIEFEASRFAAVAFLIGPDACLPKQKPIQFSEPRLTGLTPEAIRLTRSIDRATIERWFGPPKSEDVDAEETVLWHTRLNVTMEFELDAATGGLKRWNLYPEEG